MRKPWNGQTPWFDEVYYFTDSNGHTFYDIWYVFDNPAEFFGDTWADLGYESPEEYEEYCNESLIIRYDPESGKWEPLHLIDSACCTDSYPIGFELTDEEKADVNESIRILKESGDINPKW